MRAPPPPDVGTTLIWIIGIALLAASNVHWTSVPCPKITLFGVYYASSLAMWWTYANAQPFAYRVLIVVVAYGWSVWVFGKHFGEDNVAALDALLSRIMWLIIISAVCMNLVMRIKFGGGAADQEPH